jgi:3-hydroxyisobutyrate dehydrogenase-like beta-hydroxyacid dehydrogenase
MSEPQTDVLGFIGYGEAARAFVTGWRKNGGPGIHAFDIKSTHAETAPAQHALCDTDGTACCNTAAQMVAASPVIFSLVTAAEAHDAARTIAQSDLGGRLFFDCNSCSPATKTKSQQVIEAAGGRYVDVAIMSPVHPKLHRSAILLSGDHAPAALGVMQSLDMDATIAEGPVGAASGIKLCRSIIVKGLEAISAEMILTARALGVEDPVIASLDATYSGFDWKTRAAYALDRMMTHGVRRADEMDEAVKMVQALGLAGGMSEASADLQRRVGGLALDSGATDLTQRADLLARALGVDRPKN